MIEWKQQDPLKMKVLPFSKSCSRLLTIWDKFSSFISGRGKISVRETNSYPKLYFIFFPLKSNERKYPFPSPESSKPKLQLCLQIPIYSFFPGFAVYSDHSTDYNQLFTCTHFLKTGWKEKHYITFFCQPSYLQKFWYLPPC